MGIERTHTADDVAEEGLTEKLRTIDALRLAGGGWPVSSVRVCSAADEIDSLRALLREARRYVFDAEVPYEHLYDDQQNLLARIDAAAPPPAPAAPRELCDKEPNCILDKGHNGDCDDMPF